MSWIYNRDTPLLVNRDPDEPAMSRPIKRFRRNDYVGPAIWGFCSLDDQPLRVGDRVHYDDNLFTPPHRSHYVVAVVDGRLACLWAATDRDHPRWVADARARFAGFID